MCCSPTRDCVRFRRSAWRTMPAISLLCLLSLVPASARVLRVNGSGALSVQDGASWDTAFSTVTKALAAANPGDEVWVAQGMYVENLNVPDVVSVFGGFSGVEVDRTARRPDAFVTILDGNASGSVVVARGNTVVDGFTIQNGRAQYGGGVSCIGGNQTVSGNVIAHNVALTAGGGVDVAAASVTIRRNHIVSNRTDFFTSSTGGGGIYCHAGNAIIDANVIEGNSGDGDQFGAGGGMHMAASASGRVTSNVLAHNWVVSDGYAWGGGMYCESPTVIIANNTVSGNGIHTYLQLFNGPHGKGIYCPVDATIVNNIVYKDELDVITQNGYMRGILRDNIIWPKYGGRGEPAPGGGVTFIDPLLVDGVNGDYRLRPGSPAIDAGEDAVVLPGAIDVTGMPRTAGQHVDLGAYEWSTALGLADAARALRIAGGLSSATADDQQRLGAAIDVNSAVRVARKAVGLDPQGP